MDIGSITKIKQKLDELHDIDIDSVVTSLIPEGQSIDTVLLNTDLTAATFLHLYKRVVNQFRAEIASDDTSWILPLSFPNEANMAMLGGQKMYMPENILSVIDNMLDFIETKNYPYMITHLKKIIAYQMFCGFFDKSSIKQHSIKGLELNEKISRMDATLQRITDLEQRSTRLLTDSSQLKKVLEDTATNAVIAANETVSVKEKAENSFISISNTMNSISEIKGKTDQIQEELESVKTKANKQMDLYNEEVNASRKSTEELMLSMHEKVSQYNEHIKTLNDSMQTFNDRSNYLNELIGREVGASLFETFKQRKNEFHIRRWLIAVIIVSLFSIAWVYIVFSGAFNDILPESSLLGWQLFALNTLKCIPVIYLIYFFTKQYSLERRFQEEYAFKSAIALTIKAYADLLIEGGNKDQLILQSVASIQKPPGILAGQPKGKNIEDAALSMMEKTITEIAENINKSP